MSTVCHDMMKGKMMAQGTVKWYNAEKGYGFIAPDGGAPDVFVHFSKLLSPGPLEDGQRVQFEVVEGPKGPQADRVEVIP